MNVTKLHTFLQFSIVRHSIASLKLSNAVTNQIYDRAAESEDVNELRGLGTMHVPVKWAMVICQYCGLLRVAFEIQIDEGGDGSHTGV